MFNKNLCPYLETKCSDISCPCAKYKAFLDVKNPTIINQELAELGITSNMSRLEKILHIQSHFASRFHNIYNLSKETTDYWNKEYCICIEDEIEEIFDYIQLDDVQQPLKTDITELKKEVVDVLHFVLDNIISGECNYIILEQIFNFINKSSSIEDDNLSLEEKFIKFSNAADKQHLTIFRFKDDIMRQNINNNENVNKDNNIDKDNKDVLEQMFQLAINYLEKTFFIKRNAHYDNFLQKWNFGNPKVKFNDVLRTITLRLLLINREIRQQISWKHWKKPNKEINYYKLYYVYYEMLKRFIILAAFVFDDVDELINFYIRKNIENIRRQKYNY